jgi:hypothetical protein
MDGDPQTATGEELYLLIDGGAEIVQEYGFRQAAFCGYIHRAGAGINVEVYEMESPAAAYGLFTFRTGGRGKPVSIGQEALSEAYYLNAWKGRYLVTVIGLTTDSVTFQGIPLLARAAVDSLHGEGERPALMAALPDDFSGKVYFRGPIGFRNFYPFSSEMGIAVQEGVLGRSGMTQAVILQYSGVRQALENFRLAVNNIASFEGAGFEAVSEDAFLFMDSEGKLGRADLEGTRIMIVTGESREEIRDQRLRLGNNG